MLRILKSRREMVKLAKEWRFWSKRIAEAAKKILGDCEIYVFGSIVEGKAAGGSDVDVLIVSDKIPGKLGERWKLKAKIEEEAGLPLYHPYEVHLVNKEEARWYYKYVRKRVKI